MIGSITCMSCVDLSSFKKTVWNYYKQNRRHFPWRETNNPYYILVSEMMLQQTQASRVIPFYTKFISTFRTIQKLAISSFPNVLQVWRGLGYNRRAKYIHECAKILFQKKKGVIPDDIDFLASLPGLGYNTARSIITFSYNVPNVFIETNIRSVFIHHFFNDREKVHDKEIYPFIKKTLSTKNPREWYWALMDYGSYLKKRYQNPSRKSLTYSKQPQFIGSKREARGKILKELLKRTSLTISQLQKKIKTKHNLYEIIKVLEKEKMIIVENEWVRLAH